MEMDELPKIENIWKSRSQTNVIRKDETFIAVSNRTLD